MAHEKSKVVKRKGKSPLIKSPVGPSKRKPTPQERFPSRADPLRGIGAGREKASKKQGGKEAESRKKGKSPKKTIGQLNKSRSIIGSFRGALKDAGRLGYQKGGKVVSKRNGGMTRVGLSPAEEARAGVMSEAARRRSMMPTPRPPVRPTPTLQPPVRPALRPPVPQMVPRRPMNKGGTISRKMSGQEVVDMGYKGFV
jgi:hypothetical protein